MTKKQSDSGEPKTVEDFLNGKPEYTRDLFNHFVQEYSKIGEITLHPTKSMIGIAIQGKRIAHVTQLGKNFIHVVFSFERPYPDNLCFQKIAQVPGDNKQYNHHFRMLTKEDVNQEVKKFMRLAYKPGGGS
jgi:hypothetical protein